MTWKDRPYPNTITHCLEIMKLFKELLVSELATEDEIEKMLVYLYPDIYNDNVEEQERRLDNIKNVQKVYSKGQRETMEFIDNDFNELLRILKEEIRKEN